MEALGQAVGLTLRGKGSTLCSVRWGPWEYLSDRDVWRLNGSTYTKHSKQCLLLTAAKAWKQPKCPLTDEWIKKL